MITLVFTEIRCWWEIRFLSIICSVFFFYSGDAEVFEPVVGNWPRCIIIPNSRLKLRKSDDVIFYFFLRGIVWLGLLHHVPIYEVLFIISVIMYLQFIRYASIFEKRGTQYFWNWKDSKKYIYFYLIACRGWGIECHRRNISRSKFSICVDFNI